MENAKKKVKSKIIGKYVCSWVSDLLVNPCKWHLTFTMLSFQNTKEWYFTAFQSFLNCFKSLDNTYLIQNGLKWMPDWFDAQTYAQTPCLDTILIDWIQINRTPFCTETITPNHIAMLQSPIQNVKIKFTIQNRFENERKNRVANEREMHWTYSTSNHHSYKIKSATKCSHFSHQVQHLTNKIQFQSKQIHTLAIRRESHKYLLSRKYMHNGELRITAPKPSN